MLRFAIAVLAGAVLAVAASTVGAQTPTETTTGERTQPTTTVTKTVTQPAQTVTATRTATVAQESSPTAFVQVTPTSGSTANDEPSDDPLSTWAWVLIGLAVLGVGVGVYQLGRNHHHQTPPQAPPPAAPAA